MPNPPTDTDRVKGLVVLVKLSDGKIMEVLLKDDVKHRIWKIIDNEKVVLVGEDLSALLTFKK